MIETKVNKYTQQKMKIWHILTTSKKNNFLVVLNDFIMFSLIILNTILIGLHSFHSLSQNETFIFYYDTITIVSIYILLIDYILRLWSCTVKSIYSHPIKGRIKFIFSFLPMLEVLVIFSVLFFGTCANLIFLLLIKTFKITEYFDDNNNYSPSVILQRTFLNIINNRHH